MGEWVRVRRWWAEWFWVKMAMRVVEMKSGRSVAWEARVRLRDEILGG